MQDLIKAYTAKYKKTLKNKGDIDIIQDSMLILLKKSQKEVIEKPEHLLNHVVGCLRKNKYNRGKKIDTDTQEVSEIIEFSSPVAEIESNNLLDSQDKQEYRDMVNHIKEGLKNLKDVEIFEDYFLQGLTMQEISDKNGMELTAIHRRLKSIKTKIYNMGIATLYDTRFASGPQYKIKYPVYVPDRSPQPCKPISIDGYTLQTRKPQRVQDHTYALSVQASYAPATRAKISEKPIQHGEYDSPIPYTGKRPAIKA